MVKLLFPGPGPLELSHLLLIWPTPVLDSCPGPGTGQTDRLRPALEKLKARISNEASIHTLQSKSNCTESSPFAFGYNCTHPDPQPLQLAALFPGPQSGCPQRAQNRDVSQSRASQVSQAASVTYFRIRDSPAGRESSSSPGPHRDAQATYSPTSLQHLCSHRCEAVECHRLWCKSHRPQVMTTVLTLPSTVDSGSCWPDPTPPRPQFCPEYYYPRSPPPTFQSQRLPHPSGLLHICLKAPSAWPASPDRPPLHFCPCPGLHPIIHHRVPCLGGH